MPQQEHFFQCNRKWVWGILIILLVTWIFPLNYLELTFEEPRRALVSLEMMFRSNFWVPTVNGALYLKKPPLFSWLFIPLIKAFGTSPMVYRAVSVGSVLMMALLIARETTRQLKPRAGLFTLFFTLFSFTFFFFAVNYAEIDPFFSLLIVAMAWSIYRALPMGGRAVPSWFFLAYFLAALAVLTKGLPALAFLGITLLGWISYLRQWKILLSPFHLAGFIFFCGIVSGYFIVYDHYADWWPYVSTLLFESTRRTAVESSHSLWTHIFIFPWQLVRITFPGIAVLLLFKRSLWSRLWHTHPWIRFAIFFVLTNSLVYWLSPETRPRYLYMFVPFICMVCGSYAALIFEQGHTRLIGRIGRVAAILFSASAIAIFLLPYKDLVAFAWVKIVLLAAALVAVSVILWRSKRQIGIGLILGLFLLRWTQNLFYFPIRQQHSELLVYEKNASKIESLIGNAPLFLTGTPEVLEGEPLPLLSLPGFRVHSAPLLDASLSYHLERERHMILPYTQDLTTGCYYIATLSDLENLKNTREIFRFEAQHRPTYVLFTLP